MIQNIFTGKFKLLEIINNGLDIKHGVNLFTCRLDVDENTNEDFLGIYNLLRDKKCKFINNKYEDVDLDVITDSVSHMFDFDYNTRVLKIDFLVISKREIDIDEFEKEMEDSYFKILKI